MNSAMHSEIHQTFTKIRLNLCTTYNQHTTGISSVNNQAKRKCQGKIPGWDVVFGMGDIELGSPYADAEFILDMQDFGSAIAKWFYIWNRLHTVLMECTYSETLFKILYQPFLSFTFSSDFLPITLESLYLFIFITYNMSCSKLVSAIYFCVCFFFSEFLNEISLCLLSVEFIMLLILGALEIFEAVINRSHNQVQKWTMGCSNFMFSKPFWWYEIFYVSDQERLDEEPRKLPQRRLSKDVFRPKFIPHFRSIYACLNTRLRQNMFFLKLELHHSQIHKVMNSIQRVITMWKAYPHCLRPANNVHSHQLHPANGNLATSGEAMASNSLQPKKNLLHWWNQKKKVNPISAPESIKAVIHITYKFWIKHHFFSEAQISDGTRNYYTECTNLKPLLQINFLRNWTFDKFKHSAFKFIYLPWPYWHFHMDGIPTFGFLKKHMATDSKSFYCFATATGVSLDKKAIVKVGMIPPVKALATQTGILSRVKIRLSFEPNVASKGLYDLTYYGTQIWNE
ncbi:hypothetical protein VP01_2373g3 [Puccinia sorghi]|uniref:Uncharacterized protein n=1 Tax=Puccinia sorghi TaxID=27349 RepID=A0A0L6V7R2_9BASI|nr:hypothetical protein VP01_2373g3 [Puccinia sorghi]